MGNPDASLFLCSVLGTGADGGHASDAPADWTDNDAPPPSVIPLSLPRRSHRHNRFGPGHTDCKSLLGSGTGRIDTSEVQLPSDFPERDEKAGLRCQKTIDLNCREVQSGMVRQNLLFIPDCTAFS